MHWIDWLIVIIPVLAVLGIAIYSRKYVLGVVDYLAAGRMAGRYVLTVGEMTAGLGLLTLVAVTEQYYRCGIAVSFWGQMVAPISIIITLTGFCVYRFRESKALSNGQFLEMRYSKSFRVIASFIRILAEMLTNAIGPAVAVNFLIYYLGLPHKIMIFNCVIPTFSLLVAGVLILALIIILPGGRISLLITDCIQGLICYPVFVAIAVFVIVKFSWGNEIVPVMADRVADESFINPFDIEKLRDFNIFALVVMIIGYNYNRAAYAGNDTSSAGKTPHEQKMASVLNVWRMGLGTIMCLLIAFMIITFMNHKNYAKNAHQVRQELSKKVAVETFESDMRLDQFAESSIDSIPVIVHEIGKNEPMSQEKNIDTIYMDQVHEGVGNNPKANAMFQEFRSLYNQMMMPMGLRAILPIGFMGVFCLLAILLMITTDDTRIFNASTAIIQDLVIPFLKKPMTPKRHMFAVKLSTIGVAVFFFCGSLLFAQLDFINMFITIMVSIWLGAAGPIMVFGLYSRFGNTIGAYCALIFGSGTAVAGAFLQRNWADIVYPFLHEHDWVNVVGKFMETVSRPFYPWVDWKMDSVKCPITSYEFWFMAMLFGTVAYVAGSLLTYRKPFNLERLLHRGRYNTDDVENIQEKWSLKNMWGKLIGITPDYTFGDKVIVWSIFIYSFGYCFGGCFLMVIIWNAFQPWPDQWWAKYYYIVNLIVGPIIGVITTIWFFCGGMRDICRLFRDLTARIDNPLDNGMVEGHVALSDIETLGNENE